jgi:hypothetical protein
MSLRHRHPSQDYTFVYDLISELPIIVLDHLHFIWSIASGQRLHNLSFNLCRGREMAPALCYIFIMVYILDYFFKLRCRLRLQNELYLVTQRVVASATKLLL